MRNLQIIAMQLHARRKAMSRDGKLLIIVGMQERTIHDPICEMKILDKLILYQHEYKHDFSSHLIYLQNFCGGEVLETLDTEEFPIIGTGALHIEKGTLGYDKWHTEYLADFDEIELVGVYTDTDIITNVLLLKTAFPDVEITVDVSCCVGTTPENHKAAIQVMKACEVNITGE